MFDGESAARPSAGDEGLRPEAERTMGRSSCEGVELEPELVAVEGWLRAKGYRGGMLPKPDNDVG